jgi:PAS domain S-box-containing protein
VLLLALRDITEHRRAEEELKRRHQELEDFFENGAVALHLVAGDGIILRANQAELELLGYGSEEYVGRNLAEFHADANAIEVILARLRSGETLDKYPARLKAKNGTIKEVQITSSAQFEDGKFINGRCFTLDVTDQKRAENELRDRERRFRELIEALPAAIYTTDAAGWITFYNEAAAEFAGRRPELGSDQWCVSWRLFRSDGTPLPHDECPMATALKEDRPVRGGGVDRRATRRHPGHIHSLPDATARFFGRTDRRGKHARRHHRAKGSRIRTCGPSVGPR